MRNKTATEPPSNDARLDRLVDELAKYQASGVTLPQELRDAYKIVFVHNSSESSRLLEEFFNRKKRADTLEQFEDCVRSALKDHGVDGLDHKALANNLIGKLEQAGLTLQSSNVVAKELPTEAPEIYQGLRGPESPPEFVKRVYAPWLGQGLDRAHIKHLDPTLYQSINNWSRKNEWPADVDLPTRSEQTQRTIEQLKQQAPEGRIGKVLGNFTAREAQRIRSALHRDRQKQ